MVDYAADAAAEFVAEQEYDSSDPEQVNKAHQKASTARRDELDFVKAIMDLPQGRKWMYNFLATCNSFGNPVVPGDTHLTYHNLGAQNLGKKLLQDIDEAAPAEYVLMMREARAAK